MSSLLADGQLVELHTEDSISVTRGEIATLRCDVITKNDSSIEQMARIGWNKRDPELTIFSTFVGDRTNDSDFFLTSSYFTIRMELTVSGQYYCFYKGHVSGMEAISNDLQVTISGKFYLYLCIYPEYHHALA